ncbi:capsule biosynthesis protein [Profundibacterium mesophilum]|uniref:Capsule polysaccharide export inner-membrane protein KpsE n=1 Tax=Profundibacterium mesophilum KAUST100406-0324 TaxID=1037889 RepID=A0A921TC46_9RHOB|nr:capsule biosynthesis protein [Profundibacterium mesophilum]KAF0676650.1 capsule polysaccharide export inner-membrane protein KpsE [Profundibacterium mesophilum KAUST100406-0324]
MTMKPRARKFRIKRTPTEGGAQHAAAPGKADETARAPEPAKERRPDVDAGARPDTAAPGTPVPGREAAESAAPTVPAPSEAMLRESQVASPKAVADETDLSAIRKEGLTGRQLRMARRLAQKNGITATSDLDAVRQLRARGIDPFERANMLELVVPEQGSEGELPQLPQTVPQPAAPARTGTKDADPVSRSRQILDIQRDIARRRRRKLALLGARLAFFVILPTFLAGWYYYKIATPMYATKTEFVIQQAENASGGALGGLFSGTGFATSQDSIAVQSYLQSRDAMLRLDEDLGFKTHFSDTAIDPIQRLPQDASNEKTYKLYKDMVKIGYDPTEGIVKMEVVAPDPELSAEYSRRLIDYAEERVDNLTQRLRADQMSGARESFEEAEAKMTASQARVLRIQEQLGVLDPASESAALMSQIGTFETQLRQKRLELDQLLSNRRPNEARVDGVRGDIERLNSVVADLRAQMTDGSGSASSLAGVSSQLRLAEVDLQTRTLMMQQALQQLETARIEANRQVRYLSLGVTPVAPDEATYPRSFENTFLAFLIFSGLYLMISLTASILREQVSS